jgi:hypothetical protein
MKDEIVCFYHGDDLDGHASGAIVQRWAPEVDLVPVGYDNPFPLDLVPGADVVMVDFTLKPPEMYEIQAQAKSFIWIDHHEAPILAVENYKAEKGLGRIKGLRPADSDKDGPLAACDLAWDYFFDRPKPWGIYLLGRWAVHDLRDPWVEPFQFAMRARLTDPREAEARSLWEGLLDEDHKLEINLLAEGEIIVRYVGREFADYARRLAYKTELNGKRALAINRWRGGSDLFKEVEDPERPLLISYAYLPGDCYMVSLYCDHPGVNCAEIAQKYGGNGHPGAAGFIWRGKDLPFKNLFADPGE